MRAFLMATGVFLICTGATAAGTPAGSTMITMDYASYLAPIDLHFTKPTKPIEGIPLGNGRMGSLVWLDGSGSKLQFNFGRPDVFYRGSATSYWGNKSHTDGGSKIGNVDIGFQGSPFASTCNQDLHAYDGYESIQGADVSVRIVPWRDRDVFAIEITDSRAEPSAITVDLYRLLATIVTNRYGNTSVQMPQDNRLVLKQEFISTCDTGMATNDVYCSSACVIAVKGRTATATDKQLTITAGKGTFMIYVGSAASMSPKEDVVALATAEVKAALVTTFTAIFDSTVAQWHDFWKRSFIYLPATHDRPFDESFDQHWLYYLYGMNTCNRGKYPIHANGGIFNVQDGWQYWGSQYWWFNSSRQTLTPVFEQANHPELADPYFDMLSRIFPRINKVAAQHLGAGKDAIWIGETFTFDGPEILPETGPRPTRKTRSDWETRWSGGTCTRLLYNTAEAAQWYWERYEYTHDLAWLKERAYPMLKGAAELYRTYPETKLETDGNYHINNVSWAETYADGVRDGINDLASVRAIFPVVIKAAKLLKVDAELVPLWQEMLDKLAPYPTDATPQAMGVLQQAGEPVFAIGVGRGKSVGSDHDPRLMLVNVFDLVNTESKLTKPDEWQMAMNTLASLRQAKWIALNKNEGTNGGGASALARFCGEAARLGSVEWVAKCFAYQLSYWKTCRDAPTRWINRIREYNPDGGFALDWQQEATFSEGMSAALLQSGAAVPGGTPIIRVFPAWPKEMDASFTLRAKGDFLVSSLMKAGTVNFIEVTSQRGGPCTVRNFWGKQSVDLYRNNKKRETLSAELLTFDTQKGENIVIVKSGTKPAEFRVSLPSKNPVIPLDGCNVVWDSPSKDSGGSMPLGNGDIGLNAWVEENGDLVFLISKTDSWTDSGRLVKLGQVRVRLTPSLATRSFRQTLKLRDGSIEIRGQRSEVGGQGADVLLKVWVDANRPVIHIEGDSKQELQAQVGLYVWRTTDRDMQKESNIGYLSELNTGSIMEKADTVLPQKDNRIVWYHRNEGTIVPLAMRLQGMESLLPLVHDPILHNTFGGAISGKGMVQAVAGEATQALKTAAPTRRLDIAIHVLGAQIDTAEQWVAKLDSVIAEERKIGLDKAWKAHCTWWQEFWSRSWIYVQTPEDSAPATAEQVAARVKDRDELQLTGTGGLSNHIRPAISDEPAGQLVTRGYALQRFVLAASCRGAYPVKHDGSIFTVNNRKRDSLVDADYRVHGANYWFLDAGTTMYGPMLRSGDYDLLMPLFKMYSAMVPMARARTKLQYHHEGLYIPATVYAWGTYQENEYVRWLWHGGLELTAKMLDYCEATGDEAFLRESVLPLADGVITFYDQHWKRDDKGKIRMDPACALENAHEAVNPLPEIAGLRYVLPRLLALSEKTTTTAQRAAWKKTLADVPEIPMAPLKDAAASAQIARWKYALTERPEVRMKKDADKKILVAAEVIKTWQGDEVPDLYAVFPYRLYAVDSKDADIGRRTFERWNPVQPRSSYPWEGRVGGWRLSPIQAAFVGKSEQAARLVASNFAAHDPGSRFPAFWGPAQVGINDQSHGGVAMTALQAMLLQVVGKKIYLFPAWPKDWDVNFKLHALYNTTVEGELRNGKVVSLKVTPKLREADVVNMLGK